MNQIKFTDDTDPNDPYFEYALIESVDSMTVRIIDRLCDLGYDIPIEYFAMLYDLYVGTEFVAIGGNVFLDRLAQFAGDEFDRLYHIVGSVCDKDDPIFSITVNLIKVGKFDYQIELLEFDRHATEGYGH